MLQLVRSLPEQLAAGAKAACAVRIGSAGGFDSVTVAGMGGSGIGAKIVQGLLLDECRVPVHVCNDYDLPAAVSAKTLFVAVSYSGNTEETLSAYTQARRRGCRVVVITSGGELGRLAARAGYPVMPVPGGMPPRAALGYLFSTLLVCLERLNVCKSHKRGLEETDRKSVV